MVWSVTSYSKRKLKTELLAQKLANAELQSQLIKER
jgi:hypothetical protein